ncbi:hypothetical protein Sjap_016702 [Stephania japonica]|uniref:Uncharacterized protein n=1 Tax=Stephania japonica TaxID=461633 RepID=A0AAP0IM29_9MAGN
MIMKSKASAFLKQIMSVVISMVKAKSTALKGKTSAIKTRLIIFSLMKNKKVLMGAISHKLHALIGNSSSSSSNNNNKSTDDDDDQDKIKNAIDDADPEEGDDELIDHADQVSKAIDDVEINGSCSVGATDEYYSNNPPIMVAMDDEDKYPDLTHSLFDSEEEEEEESGTSVIDLVRNSKQINANDFSLEDQIDEVADLFIKRFHRRIKLQKLESFNRYQQMLQRGL